MTSSGWKPHFLYQNDNIFLINMTVWGYTTFLAIPMGVEDYQKMGCGVQKNWCNALDDVFSSKNHPATMPAMQQKWGWDQRRSLNLILDHQIWTEPNTKQESWSDPPPLGSSWDILATNWVWWKILTCRLERVPLRDPICWKDGNEYDEGDLGPMLRGLWGQNLHWMCSHSSFGRRWG